MKRKKEKAKRIGILALTIAMGAGLLAEMPMTAKAADYEARIGDVFYESIEEAFENVQAGDTITVLKDCSVSKTLEVTADSITLKSEDAENPAVISRDEGFAGKTYALNTETVLLGITGGSLLTQDIILDGGAVLDEAFYNSGKVWDSPLVYVKGTYTMEEGTVLQNNYNTDGQDSSGSSRSVHTAGALQVMDQAALIMNGGLIQNCYTVGGGGGIQSRQDSSVSATSGTIRNCYGTWGGGMELLGSAEVSGVTFSGNAAGSSGGAVSSNASLKLTDCLIEGNSSAYDGGGICTGTGHQAEITGCTITGNTAARGSAIQTAGGEGELPLIITDCTITGNRSKEKAYMGSAICYMNKTGIILDGNIVMEDNLAVGVLPCDIFYFYNEGASILLGEAFASTATFVLGGYDIEPGRVLIDGTFYGKDAAVDQFPWNATTYCTEKRDGNLYLAEIPETYSVTYNANNSETGESVICSDPGTYTSGETVTIMDKAAIFPYMGNLVKFGYDFDGWNTEPDGTGTDYAEGQEVSLTEDLYLYARWKEKEPVTITYVYNGGTGEIESEQAIPGAGTTFPVASREGYSFKGWYEDEEMTVFAGNAGERYYAPKEDTSYYAAWEKTDAVITFDADGGKMEGGSITAKTGDTIILPACSKERYEFLGWFLTSDESICIGQAGEEFTVQEDTALKAHYEKKEAVKVTITFDAGGGKEVKPVQAAMGEFIRLPGTEREGYSFLGWYTEKNGGILLGISGGEMKAVKDMTAYALWEKEAEKEDDSDNDPETCKVLFHAGKGTIKVKELTIIKDGSITLPLPERDGYDFTGWYLDEDLTQFAGAYRDTYRITEDTSFYAKWEKAEENSNGSGNGGNGSGSQSGDDAGEILNTYTVKYDANGGSTRNASVKVVKGASVKLPVAEREGYVFKGWYTDRQVFIGMEGETYKPGRSISLYARWEKVNGEDKENNSSKDNTGSKDHKDAPEDNKDTSGTVSGNAVDSASGKDTAAKTEGGNTDAGKEAGAVIQTGRTSPVPLLFVPGMCGVLLAALSVYEGKKKEKGCL